LGLTKIRVELLEPVDQFIERPRIVDLGDLDHGKQDRRRGTRGSFRRAARPGVPAALYDAAICQ